MDIGSGINCEKQMEIASSILRTEAELRIRSTRARHRGDPAINHEHLECFPETRFCKSVSIMSRLDPLPSCYIFTGCVVTKVLLYLLPFQPGKRQQFFPGFFSDTIRYIWYVWYITIRLGIAASYYFCFSSLHDLSLIGNITSKNRWIVWETALEP